MPVTHLSCSWAHAKPQTPVSSVSTPPPTPTSKPKETPASWALTAVFEVALDSCRCTCAGSQGLCGMEQTAPCSLGNSVTSQQCCKAGSKRRQMKDMCHFKPATPAKSAPFSGVGYGLTSFASSSSVSLLIWHLQTPQTFRICVSTYTFLLLTFCPAGMSFYSYHFLPPDQFA